jgi:electron transfer flavoprotein alpha subunit
MGSGILVFVETENGKPRKTAYELLGKAAALAAAIGGSVSAAVIGDGDFSGLGAYGATTVYQAGGSVFASYCTSTTVKALAALVNAANPSVVLAPASMTTKDAFPRLSVRLNAGLAVECTDLRAEGGKVIGKRPVYAGKVLTDAMVNTAVALFTVRPNSFPAPAAAGGSASVVAVDHGVTDADIDTQVVEVLAPASKEVDLTEAERIVSGGRSLKSKEDFDRVIRPLARSVRATAGASRAAVDAGYAGHGDQVGQTGKVVNPSLYIAMGISGAIQHLAGMRTSRVIVAVNKDPEAPIFQVATYGIVGDLFEIAPLLQREFESL